MKHQFLTIFVALGMLGGCGTLPAPGRQSIRFLSQPEGALVTSSLGTSCLTPCALEAPLREGFAVTLSKPGFLSQTVNVVSILSQAHNHGITLVPGIRLGVSGRDSLARNETGFQRELQPNPVQVKLEPAS